MSTTRLSLDMLTATPSIRLKLSWSSGIPGIGECYCLRHHSTPFIINKGRTVWLLYALRRHCAEKTQQNHLDHGRLRPGYRRYSIISRIESDSAFCYSHLLRL